MIDRHPLAAVLGLLILGVLAGAGYRLARVALSTVHDLAGRALARLEG